MSSSNKEPKWIVRIGTPETGYQYQGDTTYLETRIKHAWVFASERDAWMEAANLGYEHAHAFNCNNDQVVSLTMKQAEQLGIVKCKNCGWPRNNHFSWKPYPCAHDSKCKAYEAKFVVGKAIKS